MLSHEERSFYDGKAFDYTSDIMSLGVAEALSKSQMSCRQADGEILLEWFARISYAVVEIYLTQATISHFKEFIIQIIYLRLQNIQHQVIGKDW